MFILSEVEDRIRVAPADLGKPVLEAVTAVIENNYIDKVVSDLGLVITLYDITQIEGGVIFPSDGAAHYDVRFKLVVFRPFPGEVIVGRLARSDREGLHISLDFFEDILVPSDALPEGTLYDEAAAVWVWQYAGQDMFYDLGSDFRLRVKDVRFPPPPNAAQLREARDAENGGEAVAALGTKERPFAPMQVIGAASEEGCGLASWWAEAGQVTVDDMQEG